MHVWVSIKRSPLALDLDDQLSCEKDMGMEVEY